MATVTLNGISIAYEDLGSGRNVLLLIHGHPFNRSMWRPQLDAIAEAGWRVIAPDLRGYGETTVVPGKATLDVFATDLVTLLDHLGVGRVVVGGLSMGGQIAMEVARAHAPRVRALILAATSPRPETDAGRYARIEMAERLEREGMDSYAEEVLAKMVTPQNLEDLPDVAVHVASMMRTTSPQGAAAALRGRAERPSYEPTLADLNVPVLVVVGDDDAFTTGEDVECTQSLLKDATVVRMPRVGHMPNLERVSAFNAATLGFLGDVRAGAEREATSWLTREDLGLRREWSLRFVELSNLEASPEPSFAGRVSLGAH